MAGSQVAWGIDIGATSLKAIKLRRDGDKVAVEAFDVIEHDKFLSEPDVDRDSIIRTTLQKFIDRNNVRRETLMIGVAGSKTFARFVKLPPVEPKKIPEIVKFEAIQQIPFPLEQVNWDYQTFTNADSPDVEVGIFAMKNDLVGHELANFQAQKMTVHGVQLAPLALYNAAMFDEWNSGKGTVVIDIGAEHTDLVILDQGRLWLRTINLGGNHFTEALAKAFKQPFSRAEQLKRSAATSKYQKQIFQAMRPIFADLVAEVNRSLGHYQQTHRDSHLERIIAVGNPFKLPNLQKYIQQELKMEVVRLENFRKATVESKLAAGLQENILSLGVAYGLALQGLDKATIDTNLLPIEIARQMLWAQKRLWFAGAAAVVAIAVGIWGYRAWSDSSTFKELSTANDQALKDAKAKYTKFRNEFSSANSTFADNRSKVEASVKLAENRNLLASVFRDIYAALPQNVNATAAAAEGYPPDKRFIVLRSINSEYKTALSQPIPGGVFVDDDQAPATAPAPAAVNGMPARPVGPVTVDPNDRGFVLTISGYTPVSEPTQAYALLDQFKNNIKARAPRNSDKNKKHYALVTTSYLPAKINRPRVGAAAPAQVWGANKGEYYEYFVPDMMGLTNPTFLPPAVPGFGGSPGERPARLPEPGPMDPMLTAYTRDPSTATMYDYHTFDLKVKVYLKQ